MSNRKALLQLIFYKETKFLTRSQLRTHTRNINTLAIEKPYSQYQYINAIRAISIHLHHTVMLIEMPHFQYIYYSSTIMGAI